MRSSRKPVAALLAMMSLLTVLTSCDSIEGDTLKSPMPTAAPTPGVGQLVTIAGNGKGMGWDTRRPAAGQSAGRVGPVAVLPDGGLLATGENAPQVVRLDAAGRMQDLRLGYQVGRIQAVGIGAEQVGLLADGTTLLTLEQADGTPKIAADLPAGRNEPQASSVVRRTDGWWVQRGAQVLAVSDGGKVSPVTLPVVPVVLAADGDDVLVATKDEVVRVAGGKVAARMSLRGLDLMSGSSATAMVADSKGGAYVAMAGDAAVVHAVPGADPKLLVRGKAGITRCGEVPLGDLMEAPLQEIEGLAVWDGDLVIADYACAKIYRYGLAK